MPKDWEKYIKKSQYRSILLEVVKAISKNSFSNYDVKKINGYKNLYRIRIGKIRVIFSKLEDGNEIKGIDTRGRVYKSLKNLF